MDDSYEYSGTESDTTYNSEFDDESGQQSEYSDDENYSRTPNYLDKKDEYDFTDTASSSASTDEEAYLNYDYPDEPTTYQKPIQYTISYILKLIKYKVFTRKIINYTEIVAYTDTKSLKKIIHTLLDEERKLFLNPYFNVIEKLVNLADIKMAELGLSAKDLGIAIKNNESHVAYFLSQHGIETKYNIEAALKEQHRGALDYFLRTETEKTIETAANGEYWEAIIYFLKQSFNICSKIIIQFAIKRDNPKLISLVCEQAEIEDVHDLILYLINNGGGSMLEIFYETFNLEDILYSLKPFVTNNKPYKILKKSVKTYLDNLKHAEAKVKEKLLLLFKENRNINEYLCYPKEEFLGDKNLKKLRTHLSAHENLTSEQRRSATFIGMPITPVFYQKTSPYHRHTVEQTHKYFRSKRHLLNYLYQVDSLLPEARAQSGYGNEAHLGLYTNIFHGLNKKNNIPTPLSSNPEIVTYEENATLYNYLLEQRQRICAYIVEKCHFNTNSAIKVGYYNNYPCLMVLIKKELLLDHTKAEIVVIKKAWVDICMYYFIGLANYTAAQNNLDIELTRRSSFGFLTPTIAPCGESFRINVGIIPVDYADVLISCLEILNSVLTILNNKETMDQKNLDLSLPKGKNFFMSNREKYKAYLNPPLDSRKKKKKPKEKKIPHLCNILELVEKKIDRNGKKGGYNLMRTPAARSYFSSTVYFQIQTYELNPILDIKYAKDLDIKYTQFMLNALRLGFNNLWIIGNKISFNQNININLLPSVSAHKQVRDNLFFSTIKVIIAYSNKEIPMKNANENIYQEFINSINHLKRNIYNDNIDGLYYNLELLNELIYSNTIVNSKLYKDDTYGSDSEVEIELEKINIYGKKIIVQNGMRAILTSLHAGASFLTLPNKNIKLKNSNYFKNSDSIPLSLYGAYFETELAINLLKNKSNPKIPLFEIKTSLAEIAETEIMIYDINACVTSGTPLPKLQKDHLTNIKVLILDSTSASIKEHQYWIERFKQLENMKILFFVSSGFKNEQMGADKNPYGTIRIFTKDKILLNKIMEFIKTVETPIESNISHAYRRVMKRMGNVPRNRAIFDFKFGDKGTRKSKNNSAASAAAPKPK